MKKIVGCVSDIHIMNGFCPPLTYRDSKAIVSENAPLQQNMEKHTSHKIKHKMPHVNISQLHSQWSGPSEFYL